jgi:hypothetical protein
MLRSFVWNCSLVVLGALMWTGFGPASGAEVNAPQFPQRQGARALSEKLAVPIDVRLDAGLLKDALGYLSDRYNLTIIVDEMAFRTDADVADIQGALVKLDKVNGIKLRTVLRLLLEQVEAGILEQDGAIRVLPKKRLTPKILLREPISASYQKVPLAQALEELSDLTGVSVVIDSHVADQASKSLVTAKLNDVPLETAVRVLADSADLKPVALDNLIYVTSLAHAPHLEEEKSRPKAKMPRAEK